jgi:hypothetical protein
MSDEMLNKTKPYNKSSGIQGIGDTVKAMNDYDMNMLNDPIASQRTEKGKGEPSKYNKNS